MTHEELIALADRERAIVEQVAQERGITLDEAMTQLFSEGLEMRVRRKAHRGPALEVRQFRGRRS